MFRTTTLALVGLLLLTPAAHGGGGTCTAPSLDAPVASLSRTDHAVTGNRIAHGCGPLEGESVDIELTGTPAWILPDPTDRGLAWIVVLEDGTVELVLAEPGRAALISQAESPPLEPGHPPLAADVGDELVIGSAIAASSRFEAPLPDGRTTELGGSSLVALTGPTDRYPHGVLGDELEASAIEVRDVGGPQQRVEVDEREVIEGTSAMVVELVAADSGPELLVTVSDAQEGARLRAYDLHGDVVAESEPIGLGFRWLHQIGAARLAPDGELEVIVVRTPHIGGVVEAYRLVDDRLELVASQPGYSSHRLGSANLDMALLADADGDGRLDVIVPTQDMRELAILTRSADGFVEADRLELGGTLSTNVAATPDAGGYLVLAAGTTDGRLRIFR